MNKLEKLLAELVKNAKMYNDEFILMFTLNNGTLQEAQIVFSRKENDLFCLMDCYFLSVDGNSPTYNSKPFKFDMPMVHIHDFIKNSLNDENHFLLKYPKNQTILSANIYYNELMKQVDNNKKFSALCLQSILNIEMGTNESKSQKKNKV